MNTKRLAGAAAVAALLGGAAWSQIPAPPAETPRPAVVAPTPPLAPPADSPPVPAIVTPPATPPATPGRLTARGDIIETLKADARFSTFIKALEVANMTGVLKTNSNLTIFAPTNAAFAALPPGELDRLMKNPLELQKLMTYHVVNATVDESRIKGAKGTVETVAGSDLMIDGSAATPRANTAAIVQTDVRATNGTIHVVDGVLTPASVPTATATTGAARDAVATTPPAPARPAAPPEEPPTQPREPTDPTDPTDPAGPRAAMAPPSWSCQGPPTSVLTPAQKRSVQDMADETRGARPEDLDLAPALEADRADAYGADVATTEPMPAPRIVTNGPVPDTARNRAKYGGPVSRAGQRTAPLGN